MRQRGGVSRLLPGNLVLGRPSAADLDDLLRRAERAGLTYDRIASGGVGSTLRSGPAAPGVHRESAIVGRGADAFVAARAGLRRWVCHDGIGARIHPQDAPIEADTTLLVVLPCGPLSVIVPVRIVAVVDEPDRFGFAYGTLEGHHERGEEAFVAKLQPDGDLRCAISVDARPGSVPARMVGPAVTAASHAALRRYLRSWGDAVRNSMAGPATAP